MHPPKRLAGVSSDKRFTYVEDGETENDDTVTSRDILLIAKIKTDETCPLYGLLTPAHKSPTEATAVCSIQVPQDLPGPLSDINLTPLDCIHCKLRGAFFKPLYTTSSTPD